MKSHHSSGRVVPVDGINEMHGQLMESEDPDFEPQWEEKKRSRASMFYEFVTAVLYVAIVIVGGRSIGLPIYAIVLITVLGLFEVMRHFESSSEGDLQAKVFHQSELSNRSNSYTDSHSGSDRN